MLRLEQEQQLAAATQRGHIKLKNEVGVVIGTRMFARAFTSIPRAVFEEIIVEAIAVTKSWPGIIWETITSILNKVQLGPYDPNELHAILDEFALPKEQCPFTYPYVAADGFRDRFYRLISGYGLQHEDLKKPFNIELELAAAAAQCGVLNIARRSREEIGIEIDEYLIEQHFAKANQVDTEIPHYSNRPYDVAQSSSPVPVSGKQSEVFLKMKNLTSDELRILFVGDKADFGLALYNMLEISARNETRRFSPSELDLVDGRSGSMNSQCVLLLTMAQKLSVSYRHTTAKKISILRKIIRKNFGIQDDPFERTHTSGWLPRFQIEDARGLADERAKQKGRMRTISIDQYGGFADRQIAVSDSNYSFDREDDATGNWLKEHS